MGLLYIHGNRTVNVLANDLFASTYRQARDRFLRAALAAGASVVSHQHPGPSVDDQPLYSDIVRIGAADARRALLIISGTHGVEGFAGSAIQIACLQHIEAVGLPPDTALILIHALNPFGFAWYRRVDAENIDVNRNLIEHVENGANNLEYEALHEVLCPEDWNEATRQRGVEALIAYQAKHGRTAPQNVLARGQQDHPDGLFFCGRAPSWSSQLLRAEFAALPPSIERLTLLDIHTGLGPYGSCQLICGVDESSARAAKVRRWLGDGSMFFGPSSGFERLPGSIDSTSEQIFPSLELTPITVEFGTLSPLEVLQALRADNWLHRQTPRPDLDDPIKLGMRRAFCPDDADWRELVLLRGRQVIVRALEGLRA